VCLAVEPSSFELVRLGTRALGMPRRKARLRAYVLVPVTLLFGGIALAAWTQGGALLRPEGRVVGTPRASEATATKSEGDSPKETMPVTQPSAEPLVPLPREQHRVVRLAELPNEPHVEHGVPTAATAATEPSVASARWGDVSEALHAGQTERAERVLEELERDPNAETRDAATLARVQLEVSRAPREPQKNAELKARLDELARNGASSLIRRRAERLLAQLSSDE
jgi:hypothetical protein